MRARLWAKFSGGRWYSAGVIAVFVIFIALAVGSSINERPQIDEGMFASPALNLATKGFLGTTVLETVGSPLLHIHERTYWVMPLFLLNLAGWFKTFGFSLLAMRSLSIAWGFVALLSWFLIVRKLSGDRWIALLMLALLGFDFMFISGASMGRMDMMSAALGFAALAAFLNLRERHLNLAVLVSQTFVVASGMTHPNGILAFTGLLFLTLYYDRRRLNWRHFALAVAPYLIGAAGWGLYIMRDTAAFRAQFIDNAVMKGRLGGFGAPWHGIIREFTERYPHAYGLGAHSEGHAGPVYLKSLILVAYFLGVGGALLTRSIRRNRNYRALLILAAIYFLIMSIIDGQKETPYVVHIIPIYLALLAIWLHWLWTTRRAARPLIVIGLCGLFALQIGGMLLRIKHDTYHQLYAPAINFLKQNTNEQTIIMGSSALGFGLGFPDNLIDDGRFGYASGRRPDIIVYSEESKESFREAYNFYPQLPPYMERLLKDEYRLIYQNPSFDIYARRTDADQAEAGRVK